MISCESGSFTNADLVHIPGSNRRHASDASSIEKCLKLPRKFFVLEDFLVNCLVLLRLGDFCAQAKQNWTVVGETEIFHQSWAALLD